MFPKILVATDGSGESMAAVRMADQYVANGLTQEIHILNIAPNFSMANFEMAFSSTEELKELTQKYGERVLEKAEKFIQHPVTLVTKVISGDAAPAICEYAKENQCNMIIMGSRGNGQLKGLLLGSVSTKVLHYATCPVLIVKE